MEPHAVESASSPHVNIFAICSALYARYGSPRHGNKRDPLDELIYIILSTRTQERAYQQSFERLHEAYPQWSSIQQSDLPWIAELLRPYGLATLKANQIVRIVERIRADFGSATLEPLRVMSDHDSEAYLTSLPGVAAKIAKCVLMYSLDRKVLPVDVHTYRVASRVGYPVKRRADTSQSMIEAAIPPELRYTFHVNAIALGRDVCLPKNPRCGVCCIRQWCDYYRQQGGGSDDNTTG